MNPALIAVTYSRISIDRAGKSLGVERQEEDCLKLIQQQQWAAGSIYREDAISASTLTSNRRPVYERMLRHATERKFAIIVAYSTSRLTRRPKDYEQLMRVAATTGTQVWTVGSGHLDMATADGRAMLRVMAAMDAAEAERLAERQSRAAQQRAQRGAWTGGSAPSFGYDLVRGPTGARVLVINPTRAGWLRDAAVRLLAGASLMEITATWNDRGYETPGGQLWQMRDLRRVLISPYAAGLREVRGVLADGDWEPILGVDIWQSVRHILLDPGAPGRFPPRAPRRMLSALAFCGHCDAPLQTSTSRNGYCIYECYEPLHRGCARVRIRAEPLERHVLTAVALRASYESPYNQDPAASLNKNYLRRLRAIQDDHYDRLLGREDFARQMRRLIELRPTQVAWNGHGLSEQDLDTSLRPMSVEVYVLDVSVTERPPHVPRYAQITGPTAEAVASRVRIRWMP